MCCFSFGQSNTSLFASGITGSDRISTRSSVVMQPSQAELAVDSTYKLGPGDFLDLMLEDNYLTVQIYPDGTVAIEECGVVDVGGLTLNEAREEILKVVEKRYKREYCFVQLSVLKKFRVSIMGAVSFVGQHSVDPQTRLSYFIRQVGGAVPKANLEDVLVIRKNDTLHVNFNDVQNNGKFEDDIMLEQGDRIYVPFVKLDDNISLIFPGYQTSAPYKEGRTIQEYFDLVGGGRMHNFGYKNICIHEPGKEPKWIPVSEMKNTVVGPNTELEFVLKTMDVYVGGSVARIGQFDYNPSWHAIDYIAAAGINTITGTWNQVKVWRGDKPEPISVQVAQDPILPGDYIEMPKSRYESFKDFTLFVASLLTVISSAFIIYVNYK